MFFSWISLALYHVQLMTGLRGELQILVVYLLGGLRNVQCVVGDTLKVGDGVQILGHLLTLPGIQGLDSDFHKVSAQLVLKTIDGIFLILNRLEALVAIIGDQVQ